MSEAEDNEREYRAMVALDEAVWSLREFGWSHDDLIERAASASNDYTEENEV